MKTNKDNSLTIDGFQDGISSNILSGFSDMMGVNIQDNPGLASVNFKFNKLTAEINPVTFTAATNDILTLSGNIQVRGSSNGVAFTVSTTGTLPAGLAINTIYYAVEITSGTIKVAASQKDVLTPTVIDITDAGSGVHTLTVINPKQITGIVKDKYGNLLAQDSVGRVWFSSLGGVRVNWKLISGNTLTNAHGNGIINYKGYTIVWTDGEIDALLDIADLSATIVWTNDFGQVTISNSMDMFGDGAVGAVPFLSVNDDSIYFSNGSSTGRYWQVGLLEEKAGQVFDPASDATFDMVVDCITIPWDNYLGEVTAIKELGENIIIGTTSNKIYFWDKKSPSFTSFLQLPEYLVRSIEIVGTDAYALVGKNGNAYAFNTSSYAPIFKIPEQITNQQYGNYPVYFTASCVYNRELLFAVQFSTTNFLMSYNLDSKKLTKRHYSSYGNAVNSAEYTPHISTIFQDGDNIFIGSSRRINAFAYALDSLLYQATVGTASELYYCYDNYEAYVITELASIGDIYNKGTFREAKVCLSRALATGQGIKISYRRDDSSAFTALKTIDYTTYGAIKEIKVEAPITDIIDIQFKIEFSGLNLTTPRLKNITFIR